MNKQQYQYLFAQIRMRTHVMSEEPLIASRKMRDGKICSSCTCPLPALHVPGLKQCAFCADKHLVFMYFYRCYGWRCRFRTKTREKLPREFIFKTPDTMGGLAKRGSCVTDKWDQEGFELDLELGRGGTWLRLSDEP